MAIIEKRKIVDIGPSKAIVFPKGWTVVRTRDRVYVAVNRIGIVIPPDLNVEEIKQDVEKLIEEIKRFKQLAEDQLGCWKIPTA